MRTLALGWLRLSAGLASRWRNVWFRQLGVKIEGYAWLRRVSIPRDFASITLGRGVMLDDHVVLLCTGDGRADIIRIGEGTYINRFSMIDASIAIEIGRDCMIGPHCYLTDHDHGFAPGILIKDQPLQGAPTRIGDNVWIGAGAIILKGVTIGNGAVVAAGAVVSRPVATGEVVVGVPAKARERRHDAN
ncbi:MAG: DapH/DapD/GlmU-related protein [Sphingomonas sp.]|uniref:acyltransferase n=1 Tax=Sphingomonas sp. TaxID=28214 RepID=UPI003565CAA8